MRFSLAPLLALLALVSPAPAQTTTGTACTGLCLQQSTSCPNSTTISGIVYAPNGTDPLPNVQVYIPNAAVPAFTPGVSCPVVGAPPGGSPLVGTTTAVDGSFTIANVPVGTSIPLVIQTGRWRRQVTIPATTACTNTPVTTDLTHMPRNQTEGDIPLFAIATGAVDQVECVLRKVGIQDSEFTIGGGTGRIQIYTGSAAPGVTLGPTTPTEATLLGSAANINAYDVLMLPCEGTPGAVYKTAQEYANLVQFAGLGGRVYASHYSYQWMDQPSTFASVANWLGTSSAVGGTATNSILATVNTSFSDGATLAAWLAEVGAATSTNPTTIGIQQVKHDVQGVYPPTQVYLSLDQAVGSDAAPVEQFVWNTPLNSTNQCGRVLFNEYHVETGSPSAGFPAECTNAGVMTPQEKLLEYSLFELTNNGGQPTLTPASGAFGNEALGFASSPLTFSWTNNSSFPSTVTAASASGDFAVVANGCSGTIASGASCAISVTFTPTALGARTGSLTVASSGNTIVAALTGTGVPGLTVAPLSLAFNNLDVGATATQSVTLTNAAPGAIPLPPIVSSGDFTASSACANPIPANTSCVINVTFKPSATGPRTGSLVMNSPYAALTVALSGNGVDFSIASTPASGSVIAGDNTGFSVVTTPIAGFSANVALSCSSNAPATTCKPGSGTVALVSAVTTAITVTTTSQYTVVGYGGVGMADLRGDSGGASGGALRLRSAVVWLLAFASTLALFFTRRPTRTRGLRGVLFLLLLAAAAFPVVGCSGKKPALNASYTPPGTYTMTVTATDGFLTHSASYSLNVTAK